MKTIIPKALELVKKYQSEIILAIAIILITVSSFNLGKKAAFESLKTPVSIEQIERSQGTANIKAQAAIKPAPAPKVRTGPVAASKNSKLFHYPDCPGYKKIAEKNRRDFPDAAAAIAAGLSLASNCQ